MQIFNLILNLLGASPSWYPLRVAQVESSEWEYRGRTEHIVSCHFQEIPENGPDIAHLKTIHSPAVVLGGGVSNFKKYSTVSAILNHEWESTWSPSSPPNEHMAEMELTQRTMLFGFPILSLHLNVQQIGKL